MLRKSKALFVSLLFFLPFVSSVPANDLVIDFDDILNSSFTAVPETYRGFAWSPEWYVANDDWFQETYFNTYSSPSGTNAGFNGFGVSDLGFFEHDGYYFSFDGASLASWGAFDAFYEPSAKSVIIEGYKDGSLVGTIQVDLSANSYRVVDTNFGLVDQVRFLTSEPSQWYLIDDIRIGGAEVKPSLAASVISAWTNLLSTASSPEAGNYKNWADEYSACLADNACDPDEVLSRKRQVEEELLNATREAVLETAPLVYDPKPVPTDSVGLLLKARKIAENGLDALGLFWGYLFGDNEEVAEVEIAADTTAFTINPTFNRTEGEISFNFGAGLLGEEIVGIDFFLDGIDFFDTVNAFGFGTFSSYSQGTEFDRVTLNFSMLEEGQSVSVPEPRTVLLLGIGLFLVALSRQRRFRHFWRN